MGPGTKKAAFFTGITIRRLTGLVLVGLIILFLFGFLYVQARRVVINEIRQQATGVAVAAAAGFAPEDIEQIRALPDVSNPAYRRIQTVLLRILESNPDVRYMYTMRRALSEEAAPTDYEFVVDAPARDINLDGSINKDEICEPPGRIYRAANLPEMYNAWYRPTADEHISPDPPYPDLMSGYAPIKNAQGQTVAIVGVDITAQTVHTKLITLRIVMLVVWLLLSFLIAIGVQLYYQQQEALEQIKTLSDELAHRNDMLRSANNELAEHNSRYEKELQLAQSMQQHMVPRSFPKQDHIKFDGCYVTCDLPGGDFFDVFALDRDHLAIFMADAAGHGMTTALISGLFRTAFNAARHADTPSEGHFHTDLWNPAEVLGAFNNMLIAEIPEHEFVTMIYAVIDLARNVCTLASAGHPAPILYQGATRTAESWDIPCGAALGLIADRKYVNTNRPVQVGDKLLFFTDGLPGALNQAGDTFGVGNILATVQATGSFPAKDIIARLQDAVNQHRGAIDINDDFSLLIAEVR